VSAVPEAFERTDGGASLLSNPDPLEWMDSAACRGQDTDKFFPDVAHRSPSKQYAPALAVCASCPVMLECRAWNDRVEGDSHSRHPSFAGVWGVYGGETPTERHERRKAERKAERGEVA
jgi:hypothetical protein